MDYHIIKEKTCCFFGHRELPITEELKSRLYYIIEKMITEMGVDTFLFGSKSQFNSLAHSVVTSIKNEYKFLKRIYVRAEYPYIDDTYKNYLLGNYEYTYYPKSVLKAGKSVYIKRNYEMIEKSQFCIIYRETDCFSRKSGTDIAYKYAKKKNIIIKNVYQQ